MENKKAKHGLSGRLIPEGGGRHKERVQEVEYVEILCTLVCKEKNEIIETILGRGIGDKDK
jgi:hypothetical protein